jgi:hypothetical protein
MGVYGGSHAWSGMTAFLPSGYAYFSSPKSLMITRYPDSVSISAEVVNFANVPSVEFYSNTIKIAELHTPPYVCVWKPETTGEFVLTLKAIGTNDTITQLTPATVGMVYSKYGVTATSYESFAFGPWNAVDGNPDTRWSSQFTDAQWLCVDIGRAASVTGVTITWEAAFGKAYEIQVSADSLSWKKVYSTTSGKGGKEIITFNKIKTRYIRLNASQRATTYGYSIYEFQIDLRTGRK